MRSIPVLRMAVPDVRRIAPGLASCALLGVSFLPWLRDPLGGDFSAWQLPLFPAWGLASISYGWLCLSCAACILLIARTQRRLFNGRGFFSIVLYFVPGMLFLLLGVDASSLALVTRHELQFLWIQEHFGYQATTQLFPLSPLTLQTSTFIEKLQLLLNQGSAGLLVLCVCAGLLAAYHHSPAAYTRSAYTRSINGSRWLYLLCGVGVCGPLALLMCAPVGMCCEYTAKEALAYGNYSEALRLLDAARMFSPDLEQVAHYHSERGQAQYFLVPAQPTPDSQVYLATVYREQGNYLAAYQQLLGVWRSTPTAPWVVDEMDITLEELTESLRPLRGISTKRVASDDAALPWLQILTQVDSSNVYSLYMTGRIQYDLHNYAACIDSMTLVIQHSTDAAVQSSAYTYSGLCENGLGQYGVARQLLFKAVALDPNYHNNTAREELSGLH